MLIWGPGELIAPPHVSKRGTDEYARSTQVFSFGSIYQGANLGTTSRRLSHSHVVRVGLRCCEAWTCREDPKPSQLESILLRFLDERPGK